MIPSSLSRMGEKNEECSQLRVLLKGLDGKCEFGQKGIPLKGVKANQKCHRGVHAVKFPPENQFGQPQASDWDASLFPGRHGIARMVLKNTL